MRAATGTKIRTEEGNRNASRRLIRDFSILHKKVCVPIRDQKTHPLHGPPCCRLCSPMLAAENLGISFNGRRLFGGLNFTLRAGERFSLAGPNGAGKSTLMKIIAGIEHQDEGHIAKAKTITVGYLPQEGVQIKGRTLMAEAETAFADALELQREFDEVNELLGPPPLGDSRVCRSARSFW